MTASDPASPGPAPPDPTSAAGPAPAGPTPAGPAPAGPGSTARTSAAERAVADEALVEESAKKSALLWVRGPEGPARPLWHVWHEGAVCLVGDGPGEQPLAGLGLTDGAAATVTARSKDKGGRLVAWPVRVVELVPGGESWRSAAEELKGKRLNAPDAETVLERWARECRVLRLEAAGAPVQKPGAMPDVSHAAPPLPTGATTRQPAPAGLPKLLLRGRGRGRAKRR